MHNCTQYLTGKSWVNEARHLRLSLRTRLHFQQKTREMGAPLAHSSGVRTAGLYGWYNAGQAGILAVISSSNRKAPCTRPSKLLVGSLMKSRRHRFSTSAEVKICS